MEQRAWRLYQWIDEQNKLAVPVGVSVVVFRCACSTQPMVEDTSRLICVHPFCKVS